MTFNRSVFILGAGASADAGVPLMADFLEKAMALGPALGDLGPNPFELVKKARAMLQQAQSKARLDIRNVEAVFGAFEMAELFGRLGSLDDEELRRLTSSMRRVIVRTIEHYLEVQVDLKGRITTPRHYDKFGALVRALTDAGHQVSILTFNYDLGIDLGLWLNKLDIDYCLDTPQPTPHAPLPIELMKLHGSTNWAQCTNHRCAGRRPIAHWVPTIVDNLEAKWRLEGGGRRKGPIRLSVASDLSQLKCVCGQSCADEPKIIPPTVSKSGLHRELASVWQRAAHRLQQAQNIFVIGYSWPEGDHFFQQLYALGTSGETILSRFWVYNPDERVRERFKNQLLGQQARDCFGPADAVGFAEAIPEIAAALDVALHQPIRGESASPFPNLPSSPWAS